MLATMSLLPPPSCVLLLLTLATAACSPPAPTTPAVTAPVVAAAGSMLPRDPALEGRLKARALMNDGQLDAALAELDRVVARADAGDNVASLRCDRAAVLATRAAANTDLRGRERDLRLALSDCATEPALSHNLADTLIRRARDTDNDALKTALLRESLKLDETIVGLIDLGQHLEKLDDLPGALVAYERAVALSIEQQREEPRLVEMRDRVLKAVGVEGAFQSAKHSHFVARFEGYSEAQLAWSALDTLEQAWFSVGKALDLYPGTPTTVVIYTGAQYRQATAGPDWSTGLFDGKIRIREGQLAADSGTLNDTLVHEYVHAALHTLPSAVPTWFHEGLAQHFEKHRPSLSLMLARTGIAPREILNGPFIGLPKEVVPAAYATSHAIVERLFERRGAWGVIQVIAELKRGRAFDDAIAASFAVNVDALYAEVAAANR